jgi:hypothetical protein
MAVSTFSWLDIDDEASRRVREAVAALNDRETLDPIGTGSIRDAFAEALFPGTSTDSITAHFANDFYHAVHPAPQARNSPAHALHATIHAYRTNTSATSSPAPTDQRHDD